MPDIELRHDAEKTGSGSSAGKVAGESESSVIAREDSLQGRLQLRGDGRVLGRFHGEIDCEGELMIGPDAEVSATVRANRITLAGRLRGNVTALGRLRIMSSGRLEGDARVGSLIVQEGGVHLGMIRVHPEGVPEHDDPAPIQLAPVSLPVLPALESSANGPGPARRPGAAGGAPPAQSRSLSGSVDRVKKLWGEFF